MHCTSSHFLAVPQRSSRRRDRNTTTATYRNEDALDYERTLRLVQVTMFTCLDQIVII